MLNEYIIKCSYGNSDMYVIGHMVGELYNT